MLAPCTFTALTPLLPVFLASFHCLLQDTDVPEEVEKLLKKLDKLWDKVGQWRGSGGGSGQWGSGGAPRCTAVAMKRYRPVANTVSPGMLQCERATQSLCRPSMLASPPPVFSI